MSATVHPAAKQMARFVVMYETASDVDAFERHCNDVHIPLACTAEDAMANLARYATFRGMILQLNEA